MQFPGAMNDGTYSCDRYRAGGTLLHPSRPATTLDRQFYGTIAAAAGGGDNDNEDGLFGDWRAAHSDVSGLRWYTVLAAQVAPASRVPALLRSADLWPRPTATTSYVVWQWNNTACASDGGSVAACAVPLGNASAAELAALAPAAPSPDQTQWSLWAVAPVVATTTTAAAVAAAATTTAGAVAAAVAVQPVVLLGELDKYVPLSPDRFTHVAAATGGGDGAGIAVSIVGQQAEKVTLAFLAGGTVHVQTVVVGQDGTWSGVLSSAAQGKSR